MNNDKDHWAVDKRIPLALIMTIALQTAGFAFFMGTLSTRVTQAEKTLSLNASSSDRLTRVEVKLENIGSTLTRLEQQLTRNN